LKVEQVQAFVNRVLILGVSQELGFAGVIERLSAFEEKFF
jgi:hypothetical protein